MKRAVGLLAALALCLATVVPAYAGGYYRGYGHYGYKHYGYKHYGYKSYGYGYRHHRGYRHHHHGHGGAYVALGILGGALLLGTLLAQPSYRAAPAYRPSYAPQPVRRNCQPTTGTGYLNGRLATFGGTWCEDAYGNGSVVPGSEYFIGYAD